MYDAHSPKQEDLCAKFILLPRALRADHQLLDASPAPLAHLPKDQVFLVFFYGLICALPVSEITLLAFGESKKDLLESRAQHVGGYIDDTWRHVSDMTSIGVPSALVRRAWNRPQHKLDEGIDEAQHFPDWLHARGRLGYRAKTPGYR